MEKRKQKIEELVQEIRRVREEQHKIQKYQSDEGNRKQKEMLK